MATQSLSALLLHRERELHAGDNAAVCAWQAVMVTLHPYWSVMHAGVAAAGAPAADYSPCPPTTAVGAAHR